MGAWISILWFLVVLFFAAMGGGWPLIILGVIVWFLVASVVGVLSRI